MKTRQEIQKEVREFKEKIVREMTYRTASTEFLYMNMQIFCEKIEKEEGVDHFELLDLFEEELPYFKKYEHEVKEMEKNPEKEFHFEHFLVKCLAD